MKRPILYVVPGLLAASLTFGAMPASLSAAKSPSLTRIYLQAGKSIDGIGVNPVTHKAYVVGELATEGDDQKAVFVLDSSALNARSAPKKLSLPLGSTTHPPKVVPIANENEYIAIDSTRNLVFVATQFGVEENGPPETDTGDETEPPGGVEPPEYAPVTAPAPATVDRGTLTVIDGNTDTLLATWYFEAGIEPEGTAVDSANGMVYVGAKAPEGESPNDDSCISGIPIYDVGSPGDVECWTSGYIYAFYVNPANTAEPIKWVKTIPAGDDPESVVFAGGRVYAANEDDGTVTIATAVKANGTGGVLVTDYPTPYAPYSLQAFVEANPLACIENKHEADKMAAGGGSVFITDDRSRVAKITDEAVVGTWDVPGATVCLEIPNTDGGGANTANNIAFMQSSGRQSLYVVSEQDTVAIFDPATMAQRATVTVPTAKHLDVIGVDGAANRVWITDEEIQAVFVLQGACANGTGGCQTQ